MTWGELKNKINEDISDDKQMVWYHIVSDNMLVVDLSEYEMVYTGKGNAAKNHKSK